MDGLNSTFVQFYSNIVCLRAGYQSIREHYIISEINVQRSMVKLKDCVEAIDCLFWRQFPGLVS